jgi:iron complex transport system ATP-binding protein
LEFHNVREPEIFVTGGSGTGAGVYRALSRAGLGMACGILHGNDVDAFIGKSLNCRVIEEAPFIDIGVKKYQEACRFAEKVKIIIDTNFPLGDINKLNLELIKEAIKRGQQVYTLCPDAQLKARYGELSDKVIDCNCIGMLIQLITDEKERKHVNAH